jgi:hypothetical protein
MRLRLSRWAVAAALLVTACATGSERPGAAPGGQAAEPSNRSPARITVVVANEPASLYYTLAPAATRGSAGLLYDLMSPGLSLGDSEGVLRPLLVEAIPSPTIARRRGCRSAATRAATTAAT